MDNTGKCNTGDWNTGDWNTGDRNTGNCNTGDCNTGDRNAGDRNTGCCNTGNWNTGNCNTGNYNTGYCNTGNWNAGNWNAGYFNTDSPKIRMFNKDTNLVFGKDEVSFPNYFYFYLIKFIPESEMPIEEKENHKNTYKIVGGYLFTYDYKEAFIKSFKNNCDKEQAEMTINLPNFDYGIFEEISGITKEMLEEKIGRKNIENPKEIILNNCKYIRSD